MQELGREENVTLHVTLSCSALGLEHRWSKVKASSGPRKSKLGGFFFDFRKVKPLPSEGLTEMANVWLVHGRFWRSLGVLLGLERSSGLDLDFTLGERGRGR